MTGNVKGTSGERLTLRSQITELAQLHEWIDRLASRCTIPLNTQFAMNICLEEILANIIKHGYSGRPDRFIALEFANPREGYFVLSIEDEAPPFNPVAAPVLPPISSLDENQIGGQGIRLVRRFADALDYQATPAGNRLIIGFSAVPSAVTKDLSRL